MRCSYRLAYQLDPSTFAAVSQAYSAATTAYSASTEPSRPASPNPERLRPRTVSPIEAGLALLIAAPVSVTVEFPRS